MRLVFFALTLPCLFAQQFDPTVQPNVYSVPGMADVAVKKDLTYTRVDKLELQFDLYLPRGLQPNERRPVVVLINGGGAPAAGVKGPKDWAFFTSTGRLLAASGLAAIPFNKRAGPLPTPEDTFSLIEYLREHAGELQIDKDRLALVAYSAGGPGLAVGLQPNRPYIRCLVGFYAVLQQSPDAPAPPILLARAGKDTPALNAAMDSFFSQAIARDLDIEMMNLRGAPHAFDLRWDTPQSREAVARMIVFLKTHLER